MAWRASSPERILSLSRDRAFRKTPSRSSCAGTRCEESDAGADAADGDRGDGTRIGRPSYALVSTDIRFTQAAAGPATCAIDIDAKLWCWGDAYSVPDGNAFAAVPRRIAE